MTMSSKQPPLPPPPPIECQRSPNPLLKDKHPWKNRVQRKSISDSDVEVRFSTSYPSQCSRLFLAAAPSQGRPWTPPVSTTSTRLPSPTFPRKGSEEAEALLDMFNAHIFGIWIGGIEQSKSALAASRSREGGWGESGGGDRKRRRLRTAPTARSGRLRWDSSKKTWF